MMPLYQQVPETLKDQTILSTTRSVVRQAIISSGSCPIWMSKETIALQFDMFLQDYVDNRSTGQKRKDRERQKLQQGPLFSIHEMAQMTANARPWLNEMPTPLLELEIQEGRTEEEIERDRRREAESLTAQMFADQPNSDLTSEPESLLFDDQQAIDYRVALFYVGKHEMALTNPGLKQQIDRLEDTEIEAIASRIEETLEAVYRVVLTATVTTYCAQKVLAQRVEEPVSPAPPAASDKRENRSVNNQTLLSMNLPMTATRLPMAIY